MARCKIDTSGPYHRIHVMVVPNSSVDKEFVAGIVMNFVQLTNQYYLNKIYTFGTELIIHRNVLKM